MTRLSGHIMLALFAALNAQAQPAPGDYAARAPTGARDGTALDLPAAAESLVRRLVEHGFENVAATAVDGHAVLTYENRIYRYEIRALQEVLQLAAPDLEGMRHLTLIPQSSGIPLVAVTVPLDAYRAFVEGELRAAQLTSSFEVSLRVDPFWRQLKGARRANRSAFKPEVVVHPQFAALFGNFNNPVEAQVNVAPEVRASLWKGMRLSAQVILPLHNELEPEGDDVRPGLLTLNQTLRLPRGLFVSATAGYFTNDRYGLDAALKKYFANGRWALGANVGYTGSASFRRGAWYTTEPSTWTPSASLEYHVPRYALSLQTSYGRFLFDDTGWRVDVRRAFGEVEIGFYGLVTERGENAGFHFVVPLFPRRYTRPGYLRIRPARAFQWEYRYRGLPQGGRRYETGIDIEAFRKGLVPAFIANHAAELRGWRSRALR